MYSAYISRTGNILVLSQISRRSVVDPSMGFNFWICIKKFVGDQSQISRNGIVARICLINCRKSVADQLLRRCRLQCFCKSKHYFFGFSSHSRQGCFDRINFFLRLGVRISDYRKTIGRRGATKSNGIICLVWESENPSEEIQNSGRLTGLKN